MISSHLSRRFLISNLPKINFCREKQKCWKLCQPSIISFETCRRDMKIYTKTGDKGTSSLFTGERRSKSNQIFQALGDVDELNSFLGLANHHLKNVKSKDKLLLEMRDLLVKIQSILLDVGACIATPVSSASDKHVKRTSFDPSHITDVENQIDQMTKRLPLLRNFILPGGGLSVSHLHVCRSVCRRAERKLGPLLCEEQLDPEVVMFVNRLSDYFFTCARFTSMLEGEEEIIYKKPKN